MEHHNFWKDILAAAPYGIIVTDADWNVLLSNPVAQDWILSRENQHNILPQWLISAAKMQTSTVNHEDRVFTVTSAAMTLDGTLVHVLFFRDDTAEVRSAKELLLCRRAIDSVTDLGLMALDLDGRVVLYNKPSAEHDGTDQDSVLGSYTTDWFSHHTASTAEEVLRTGQPVIDQQIVYTSKTGKENVCFGSTYPILENGQMLGVFSVIRFNDSVKQLLVQMIELQKELLDRKNVPFNGAKFQFSDIVAEDPEMLSTIATAKRAAFTSSPVLIYGETGTGKELFAQSIHNASVERDKPFVAINCAAIPASLLESTLFGTVKGAFTDAQNTPGLFEQAGEGTLFLDEINSMPLDLQAKLLRVLQEKTIRRIGAQKETSIHCRVISSCNKPPQECVMQKTLRDDLYYRLAVICIEIPPLRERRADIIPLANDFLRKYAPIYGASSIQMTKQFQDALLMHKWPGNVRELQHVIESSLVMLEPGEALGVQHLQPHLRRFYLKEKEAPQPLTADASGNLKERLAAMERTAILTELKRCNWNITETARKIGYTRSNLQYRMRKLSIWEENPHYPGF